MKALSRSSYMVKKEGKTFGPLASREIVNRLETFQLGFNAQVFNQEMEQWLPLAKFPAIAKEVSLAMKKTPNRKTPANSIFTNWSVTDGNTKFGPFSLIQMIQYIQQKRLDHDQLVYHPSLSVWKKLSTIEVFKDSNIAALHEFEMLKPLFTRRKNPRVRYENAVLVYDENAFYNATSWSLSNQGIGIVVEKETPFKTGKSLKLHIQPHQEHGAIQLQGRVVSRSLSEGKDKLGLKFDFEIETLNEYIDRRVPYILG